MSHASFTILALIMVFVFGYQRVIYALAPRVIISIFAFYMVNFNFSYFIQDSPENFVAHLLPSKIVRNLVVSMEEVAR
jgi:hypothetical protein